MTISIERRLNRHASTIFIGGIFISISVLMFLSLCNMPCEDCTYRRANDDHRHGNEDGSWRDKIFAQPRDITCEMVVLVMTGPDNSNRRYSMRETWLSNLPKDVVVYFVIGTASLSSGMHDKLARENIIHKDLLLIKDHLESYSSLSEKLVKSFVWIHEHIDFKFVLKVDDDSFVQMTILLSELKILKKNRLYWGFFDGRAHVKHSGKWTESSWNLCDRYLPYALGGGYVLSSDLVHYIASNAQYLKRFISEDVSLGAWLAPLDITRKHDSRFDTEFKSRGCHNSYIVTHKKGPLDMRDLHQNLQATSNLCRKEHQDRKSYVYNWNVPPTLCCIRNSSFVT